jgi:hypothetical protein
LCIKAYLDLRGKVILSVKRVKINFLCVLKDSKGFPRGPMILRKNVLVLLIILIICFLLYYTVIIHN